MNGIIIPSAGYERISFWGGRGVRASDNELEMEL